MERYGDGDREEQAVENYYKIKLLLPMERRGNSEGGHSRVS